MLSHSKSPNEPGARVIGAIIPIDEFLSRFVRLFSVPESGARF